MGILRLSSRIICFFYDNFVLFHLWPIQQGSIDEAHLDNSRSPGSSAQDTLRYRPFYRQHGESDVWRGVVQLSAPVCYSLMFVSLPLFYLAISILVDTSPLGRLCSLVAIATAIDGSLTAFIVGFFIHNIRGSRRRWLMHDRSTLAKLLCEVTSGILRAMFMLISSGLYAHMRFSISLPFNSLAITANDSAPQQPTLPSSGTLPWWCIVVAAALATFVLLHAAFLIWRAEQLIKRGTIPARRDSGPALESRLLSTSNKDTLAATFRRQLRSHPYSRSSSATTSVTSFYGSTITSEPEDVGQAPPNEDDTSGRTQGDSNPVQGADPPASSPDYLTPAPIVAGPFSLCDGDTGLADSDAYAL